jgi:hypothetical protein
MKTHLKIIILLYTLYSILYTFSFAQNVKDSSLFVPMLKFSYAVQLPGENLAKRFGVNSNIGLNFSVKTKNKWLYGISGTFLFGNNIKENGILDSLKTSSGFIINQNGNPSVVRLFERGFTISLYAGRIFQPQVFRVSPNKNSGIIFYAGPTYIQHKIKIDDIGKQSPQLVEPYPKGYDRLTAGFGMNEFLGYMYLGNNRILNFFAGFDFVQAFTKSQRSFDYDLMRRDTANRKDFLYGFRIGWILPLYKKAPREFYY